MHASFVCVRACVCVNGLVHGTDTYEERGRQAVCERVIQARVESACVKGAQRARPHNTAAMNESAGHIPMQQPQGSGGDVCHPSAATTTCAGANEPCFEDRRCGACATDPHSCLGCGAGGHELCRFCGFDQYKVVECPVSPSTVDDGGGSGGSGLTKKNDGDGVSAGTIFAIVVPLVFVIVLIVAGWRVRMNKKHATPRAGAAPRDAPPVIQGVAIQPAIHGVAVQPAIQGIAVTQPVAQLLAPLIPEPRIPEPGTRSPARTPPSACGWSLDERESVSLQPNEARTSRLAVQAVRL